MIKSELVKIKRIENFDNLYIEACLKELNKFPIRWAIVDVDEKNISISCSYEYK